MFFLWNAHDLLSVSYPLFQLKGKLEPFCGCVQVAIAVNETSSSSSPYALCGANFKVFLPLRMGTNHVVLSCQHHVATLRLIFNPPNAGRGLVVQPVYVVCADEDGSFQTLEGYDSGTVKSACKRIGLAIRLLQSLQAESFLTEYGNRLTFQCEEKSNGQQSFGIGVDCLCHHSKLLTKDDVYGETAEVVWSKLARELCDTYADRFTRTKWIAFMACTRFKCPSGQTEMRFEDMLHWSKAHFALGTGGLALLGTASLHAWPESLDDLPSALTDSRRLDETDLMNDTAYRNTFWAAFATGLGSVWHELGHCFGLDHSPDGIMNRGGDDVHLCLGFPPHNDVCGEGCDECEQEELSNVIPIELNPPAPYPTVLQFHRYTQLLQKEPPVDTRQSPSAPEEPLWATCHSVWHQGNAFWGAAHIAQLARCPWIFSATTDAQYSRSVQRP